MESSNSNRDIISETKSVQGVNQSYSPFTPRLNESVDDPKFPKNENNSLQYLQKSGGAPHHSKSVCERDNFFNLMESSNQEKAMLSVAA